MAAPLLWLVVVSTLAAGPSPAFAGPADAPKGPDPAAELIGAALTDGRTWARLEQLTDEVGPRLSGSPGAARAVQWALRQFAQDGVPAHLEPVTVTHWIRGVEVGERIGRDGRAWAAALTALGGSPPTPRGGLTAPVVEVHSFPELHALGAKAKGTIVFFNHPMARPEDYEKYGELRMHGAAEAAKAGAVAMLVRSLATASLRSPHTGMTRFDAGGPAVPAAALAVEDAEALHRALQQGPTRFHLLLGCATLPKVRSDNVIAEIRGREHPEQVVLLGAHLDSWDLATGAEDDGAGVAMAMEAAALIAHQLPAPRRTVRIVLFMNEENGLEGAQAYAHQHAAELEHHVAALEADSGGWRPVGVAVHAGAGAREEVARLALPLAALGAADLMDAEPGGADLLPLRPARVPVVGVRQDGTHYFDFHHSAADTLDHVPPRELAAAAAAFTWMTYALAEEPTALSRPTAQGD